MEIDKISAAMAEAFAAIEGAIKGKTNPAFRSKYADLGSVTDAIKPALAGHGLWYRQVLHPVESGVCVETIIHHASGQWMACGPLHIPASKQDAQGYGSALTYARRYSLMAAFGVPAEDDDGNAAVVRQDVRESPARAVDDAAAEKILAALREAAMKGMDALRDAVAEVPASPAKKAVWAQHGAMLKAAAEKVPA
jgi:hypothetical protein